jgi:hypothetical protein
MTPWWTVWIETAVRSTAGATGLSLQPPAPISNNTPETKTTSAQNSRIRILVSPVHE